MITGFNTDVEHEGVVYHIQTEDKGLETPLILSLVYVGGAILASKRSPYDDLVAEGFDATTLTERLQRQHKLICAAISAGRIEELKRLNKQGEDAGVKSNGSRKAAPARTAPPPAQAEASPPSEAGSVTDAVVAPPPAAEEVRPEEATPNVATAEATLPAADPQTPRPLPPAEARVARDVAQPVEESPRAEDAEPAAETSGPEEPTDATESILVEVEGELHVSLMEERDYRAGEIVTLRVRVSRGPFDAREAVSEADVTVKVLGTEFRPLILTSKTDRDGVAVVHAWLPRFTSGRAAILVRAAHDGYTAEMRRAVRHL